MDSLCLIDEKAVRMRQIYLCLFEELLSLSIEAHRSIIMGTEASLQYETESALSVTGK